MGLRKRLFAASYDRITGRAEKWLAPYRQRTAGRARGHALEIGAGTGANLPFYPEEVRATIVEPNPHMARRLERKARALGREVTILADSGESLPFPDATFDSVVTTLVLCSVRDLEASLREVRRVLKPGGSFFFYEHVAAQGGWTLRFQNWVSPFWKFFADGCHLNRDIESAIRGAGFSQVELEALVDPKMPPLTRPTIIGQARP